MQSTYNNHYFDRFSRIYNFKIRGLTIFHRAAICIGNQPGNDNWRMARLIIERRVIAVDHPANRVGLPYPGPVIATIIFQAIGRGTAKNKVKNREIESLGASIVRSNSSVQNDILPENEKMQKKKFERNYIYYIYSATERNIQTILNLKSITSIIFIIKNKENKYAEIVNFTYRTDCCMKQRR